MTDPSTLFRLDGRTAIVTGASSGLGTRFAHVLAAAGATVVVTARRAERLDSLASTIPGSIAIAGDIADGAHIAALVEGAIAATGRLDILVNNAGVTDHVPAEDEPIEQFRQVIDVNLTAVFALSKATAQRMLGAAGGSIINVASVLGLVGLGQMPQAGYAASKGAIVNLTRELAAQWARRGIRVNALCPGWFPSEMTTDLFSTEAGRRWIARKTPMGRPGLEHELDGALLYLASDASTYATGTALTVDGGYCAV